MSYLFLKFGILEIKITKEESYGSNLEDFDDNVNNCILKRLKEPS